MLAALAPLIALTIAQFSSRRSQARASGEQRTAEVARLIASRLDEFALRIEMLLQATALSVRLDPRQFAWNDSVLTLLASRTLGSLGTLNVRDTADRLLGTSYGDIGRAPRLATRGRRYFEEALRTRRFAVGEPARSRMDSTVWVVSFGLPIRAPSGAVRAVAFSTFRIDSLRYIVDPGMLPPGSVINVLDVDGRILFRSIDPGRFVGRDVRSLASFGDVFRLRAGTTTAPSELDGIHRVVAWQRVERAPWTVLVGIPIAVVMAEETADARRDLLVAALTLTLALLGATLVAGRIIRPIEQLTADAQAIAAGDLARRSAVSAGGELGVLARQFNAMAESLDRSTRTLREDEERYRALFELSPLPTLLADEQSLDLLMVNDAALQLYGYSREEMLSLTARDIRPPEDLPGFEAAIRPGSPRLAHRRAVHRKKNGETMDVEVFIARSSAFGRDVWLAAVNDLTQRERTEAALRASQEQLRQMQKIEAVGSLAAGIAHDFNNLLTGILGSLDLALYSLPQSHAAHEELGHARDAAVRATDLTRRLLTFSRQQATALAHVDVRDVVREMQPLFARTLGEHVRLDLRLDSAPCTVLADAGQLEQVILNLLVNARDAMPGGGVATVDVRPLEAAALPDGVGPDRCVLLAVSDTGAGMDAATAARAFEPFFTTKERGKGTGLGLSVVFSIVQNAGGQIRVETAPDEGSSFRVYLPFRERVPPRRASPAPGKDAATGAETILLVEDDDAVRRVTARLLEAFGYRVLSAAGPRQALDLARDHVGTIDLLFTDVVMPGMSGREMAEAMLKLRPRLHVVYASGYTDDVALLQQLREQALFFLQKPFTSAALGRMVRTALDTPPGAS